MLKYTQKIQSIAAPSNANPLVSIADARHLAEHCHFAYIAHMTQRDAIALIDHPLLHSATPTRWADLGCGSGTFTRALAGLLPSGSTIEAIDLRPGIGEQTTAGGVTIIPRSADFVADAIGLSGLDGILMANSLHYVRDKPALLQKLRACYREQASASGASTPSGGALLLVEYDTDRPTPHWVPYPLSFAAAAKLLPAAGWPRIQKLGARPSVFGRSVLYAALGR
jgi:ubiquinone/menaquinone biosynthesis C-methylase UbiE